jgi:hypothetical protein
MQFEIFRSAPPVADRPLAAAPLAAPHLGAEEPRSARDLVYALLGAATSALPSGAPFRTAAEAVAWGSEVLGLPYPAGGWTLDDVYDAVEGAAHHRLAGAYDHLPLGERIRAAAERETDWFHGRALTEQARAEAQFSTPLPIAEGAAAIVAAARVHSVLEPCAGTGSLVRPLLHLPRMQLFLNEPDPRRRDILVWLGFKPTDRDALRLPMERVRFDAVLSNPPFGAMNRGRGGRGATEFAATNIAQRFAAAHLRSLRPHGLLVALLPASTLSDAGVEFRRWIEQHHTPLLYLDCPEGSYRSRGALRDAMLLVARQGKAEDSAERVLVTSPSWDTWTGAVESVASRVSGSAGVALPAAVQQPGSANPPDAPAPRPAIIVPSAQPTSGTLPGDHAPANSAGGAVESGPAAWGPAEHRSGIPGETAGEPAATHRPAPALAAATATESDPSLQSAVTVEVDPATDPDSAAAEGAGLSQPVERAAVYGALDLEFGAPAPLPRSTPDWAREARERQAAEASNVFAPFVVALLERRAPHPRLVVETRSMAGMPAPALQRQRFASPLADDAWGRSGEHGGASDEQAELSLRALDAWDRGHGFLCADDVGVGKSREIALLILEAIEEGATRILLTTKNENNVRDLEHELRRVASGRQHGPFPAQIIEVANYREAKGEEGVLPRPAGPTVYLAHAYNLADFAHALIGVQPTIWLADEAHEFSNVADSKRGIAWTEIHQAMLKYTARFAYFTATPAVTLNQLCYLYGLRLWSVGAFDAWLARKTGKGNPDETEEETSAAEDAVEAHRTEAALVGESSGLESERKPKRDYIRADAFSIRTTPAETEQVMRELRGSGHYMSRDLWRGGVSFEVEWIDLLGDPAALARYNAAAELCRDLSLAARQFGLMNEKVSVTGLDRAMIQGYLKQLLFDLRLDSILRRADQALDQGRKVVISIHSVAGDEDDAEALSAEDQEHPVSHRLEAAINRINIQEVRKESTNGETVYRDLGEIPEALIAREELRTRAAALPRLRDPVRTIEQHFGASRVAAITGRIPARLRTLRMGEFQAGVRDVAVISRAGKVGISLHDVIGCGVTMLIGDYEWSAFLFKQELGRVDRTGQLTSPEIVLNASTCAGERRFASNVAAHMASLGATCKGSAESTGTDALEIFDMAGGIALEAMKNAVARMSPRARRYFTGTRFLEVEKSTTGAWEFVPKHRPEPDTQMRHFLLEMLMFPIEVANSTLTLWEEERDKLLTDATREALSARRTGRIRGTVLRERALPRRPPMVLVDVESDDGDTSVIAQGFVTEHMVRIQAARGPDADGGPRTRRYVQFTAADGRLISGLELTPSEAHRVRWSFGVHEQRDTSPQAILEDLRVGEKIDIQGPSGRKWKLHLRRDGRIEIRGAKISRDQGTFMRPSLSGAIAYEAAGNFYYLAAPESLAPFLELFPVAEAGRAVEETDEPPLAAAA